MDKVMLIDMLKGEEEKMINYRASIQNDQLWRSLVTVNVMHQAIIEVIIIVMV